MLIRTLRIQLLATFGLVASSESAIVVLLGTGTVRSDSSNLDIFGATAGDTAQIRVEFESGIPNVLGLPLGTYRYNSPSRPYDPFRYANLSFTLEGHDFSFTGGEIVLGDRGNQFLGFREVSERFNPDFHMMPGVVLLNQVGWRYQIVGWAGDRIFETLELPQSPQDLDLGQIATSHLTVSMQPVGPNPFPRRGYTINFDIDPSSIRAIPEPSLYPLLSLAMGMALFIRARK